MTGDLMFNCFSASRENIPCPASFHLVDPLAMVPDPTDDRTTVRTWPGRPEKGRFYLHTEEFADDFASTPRPVPEFWVGGHLFFTAHLPHRYGDVGWTGHGVHRTLYANAGWYPQVVDDASGVDRPVVATWDVTVSGPGVVVLNGAVGTGESHWTGISDRVALAILPDGRVDHVGGLTIVDTPGPTPASHPLGHRLLAAVAPATLPAADPGPLAAAIGAQPVTVVVDTDLRHLARPAPGMVYLSDRAFRLLGIFRPYHARAVRQAMLSAATPLPSGWDRDFVADALTRTLPAPDLRRDFAFLAWNPVVDALLNDGTLPYYDDFFDEAFDDDPELLDVIEARTPARTASRQLDALLGPGAALGEASRLLGDQAADPTAPDPVPAALRAGWLTRYDRQQDYEIVRSREHGVERATAIRRDAVPTAPPEVVTVDVDGKPAPWLTKAGPDAENIVSESSVPVTRVRVDPNSEVAERTRANDHWPLRWDTILSGGLSGFSPTQSNLDAWGELVLRPQGDTRSLAIADLEHDTEDLLTLGGGYVYGFGPLVDRLSRTEHLFFSVSGSWLDPAFRPTTNGQYAVGAYASWSWETRQDRALSGHRLSGSVSGGFVPGSAERWAAAGVGATQLVPISPRQVLAVRVKAGWATGDVAHRLLPLGGGDNLRAVPEALYVANERLVTNLEYRLALFRNAEIPLPLLWASELQVAPGLEAGSAWADDGTRLAAVGGTLGIHAIADGFGARPTLAGVTVAMPLWSTSTWGTTPLSRLQVYVQFDQGF